MSQEADLQNQSSNDALLKVASQLLEQTGINKDDFFSAISALQTAKAQNPEAKADVNKNYVDKTPVYDETDLVGDFDEKVLSEKQSKALTQSGLILD